MRVWLIIAMLFASLPAFAQSAEDEARARELFDNGSLLYDEGRYEDAVVAFQAAYDISKKPLLLYNMASALERLARWDEALEALNSYRAFAKADERENLESRIRNIQQRIDERDAEVPAPVPVPAPIASVPEPEPELVVQHKRSPLGPVLIGTGSAGVVLGAVFTGLTLSSRSKWGDLCEDRLCPTEAEDFIQQDNSRALIADVGWIVGVGALGSGIAISMAGKSSSDLALSPTQQGLILRGEF